MKKTIVTLIILIYTSQLFSQINIEIRNLLSIYGVNTEYFFGYKYKKINSSFLFTLNGDKGINNEFYLIDNQYNGVFINHKIYFDKYNAFIFDLPQLGYVNHIDKNISIKCVMGPDIVNFANIGIGVNYYF